MPQPKPHQSHLSSIAEHCALYQYNLHGAQNHWIGFAQTETVSPFLSVCTFSELKRTSPTINRSRLPPTLTASIHTIMTPSTTTLRALWHGPCMCSSLGTLRSLVRSFIRSGARCLTVPIRGWVLQFLPGMLRQFRTRM